MPIYEFYCSKCNVVFNFFSKSVDTGKRPACPRCRKQKLEKLISSFAMTGKAVDSGAAPDLPIDESKMERAMATLAGEAEKIKSDDPRQAAKLIRKFTDMTGLEMGGSMNEALNRLEAGEDPEKIESEMGGLMNGEDEPFILPEKGGRSRKGGKMAPPMRDKTLYEM
jgi:putative FmdB family regulatory protein